MIHDVSEAGALKIVGNEAIRGDHKRLRHRHDDAGAREQRDQSIGGDPATRSGVSLFSHQAPQVMFIMQLNCIIHTELNWAHAL